MVTGAPFEFRVAEQTHTDLLIRNDVHKCSSKEGTEEEADRKREELVNFAWSILKLLKLSQIAYHVCIG